MKKKWLIAIATSAMAVTVALGISACGKKNGKSDEDIATEALDTLTQVYSTALTETSADFDLLGQVLVDGERYTVTWTATSTVEGIENYVSIAQEMNEDKKFHVTISRTTIEVPYTLTASVTVGKVTKSENFLRKIPAKSSETSLTATLDLSTKDTRTTCDSDNGEQVWKQNGVTLTNTGSIGDYAPIRLYKNTTVTITMDGAKIIHIDFHSAQGFTDNPYPEYLQQSLEASDLPIKGEIAVSEDGLTFSVDFETPLEEVTFKTTAGQCRLTSIDVEGEARDPNEHVHKWSYEHIANTWTHKATCTAEGCDVNTKTEACTPKLNVCECGYTYTAKEIVDALFALKENESLPGTYTLTGVVTAITDPYSDQYKNVTFEMTVEGQTVKAFRVKGTYATEVAVGGTVTVNGELLDYSGTKEFTQGGSVVAFTPATDERTAQQKVNDALKALAATFTVTKTGETELPASTVTGVTFAWSTTNQTYTITGNKIKVDALPTADATVTATVTATCGTESVTNNTKTVTITIKAASEEPEPNKYGTKDEPLSVAEALALAEEECASANDVTEQIVYATGIALSTPAKTSSYYSQFELRDETDTNKKILVYSINLDANVPAIAQNDIIIIYGYIKNYSGTIEFASNNNTYVYCASNTRGTSTITLGEHTGATVTGLTETQTKTNGTEVSFTVTAEQGKKIASVKAGTVTLEAEEENTYKFTVAGDVTVTVETVGEGEVLDEMVTLSFADKAQRTTQTTSQQVWSQNSITFTNDKGSATSNVADYANPARCYKGSSIKVEYTKAMNKIVFHCASDSNNKYATALVTSIGTQEGVTVTRVENDVTVTFTTAQQTFTVATLSDQVRINSLDVYYTPASATVQAPAQVAILPGKEF